MKPNLRSVIDAFYEMPPFPGGDARLPLLTLWMPERAPVTVPIPPIGSPLENASRVLMAAISGGVKLDAVMFVSEMWSAPADDTDMSPTQRREAVDPAVVTAVTADYYDAENHLVEYAVESRGDDGTVRLVTVDIDGHGHAVSEQAASFRLLAELAVLP